MYWPILYYYNISTPSASQLPIGFSLAYFVICFSIPSPNLNLFLFVFGKYVSMGKVACFGDNSTYFCMGELSNLRTFSTFRIEKLCHLNILLK